MATLQKIRTKAGVFISVLIGIALLAFILTDLLNSGGSLLRNKQFEIAEIGGETVDYTEYQNFVNEKTSFYELQMGRALSGLDNEQIRSEAWRELVKSKVIAMENHTLGLEVSPAELLDLVTGENIDPMVRQIFTDPNTGQVNTPQLMNFLRNFNQVEGDNRTFWLYIEKQIYSNRLNEKYNNLISKGVYTTKLEVEVDNFERSNQVDFDYVLLKYETIADADIKITDSDIKAYYNENKDKYEQKATRDIRYVTFEVKPSERDVAENLASINQLVAEFKSTKEAEQYVGLNSETVAPALFVKKGDITYAELDSFVFTQAVAGDVFGPYTENEAYKLAKVIEFASRPDSVRARHILIRPEQNGRFKTMDDANRTIDSLMNIVKIDSTQFSALAATFGMDGTSTVGGDLGWFKEGAMVKEFNDSCFAAREGKILKLNTQFGVHLVQVTGRGAETRKAKIAYIDRAITPSDETRNQLFAVANRFAGENQSLDDFEKSSKKMKYNILVADNLNDMDRNIPGLDSPRELVKWAYEAELNQVSKVFEFGDIYVVAILTAIREEGIAPVEQVKAQITVELMKQKKAEKLTAKLNEALKGAASINDVASKLGTTAVKATAINFNSFQVTGAGADNEVIGFAVTIPKDKLSKPIESTSGVFVINVTSVTPAPTELDLPTNRQRINQTMQARVAGNRFMDGEAYRALSNKADIKDRRAKFE